MIESFTKFSNTGNPILLWGGTMYGEIAYYVITQVYGKEVEAVIDNKYKKLLWTDRKIIRSETIVNYNEADIIICAANSYQQIKNEIIEKYLTDKVKVYDMKEILEEYCVLYNKENIKNSYLYGDIDLAEIVMRYNFFAGIENGYEQKLYLPYCVLCITNRCTLKCKDCAAFITKYKQRRDYDFNSLINSFQKVLDIVDGITELELMGGEPFLHQEFNKILQWCLEHEKIHAIKIISNGTIMPSEEIWCLMKDRKIKLVIDNYGELSVKIKELSKKAKEEKINFQIQDLQTWYQIEPIKKRNSSKSELQNIYAKCNFRTCIGITNGKLYHCNVAGHMHTAGLLPDNEAEFIQLEGIEWEHEELREKVKDYINISCLKACSWCGYSQYKEIEVAKQL